jgi:putative transposase
MNESLLSLAIIVDSWYTVNIMEYQHSANQVYLINYHLVWCPKRRRKILVGGIKARLETVLQEVADAKGVGVLALEIQPDHLHMFVSCYPQLAVHKLVKAFKGRSSFYLRQEFPSLLKLPSLWTNSYFVSTAGNVSSEAIRKYIEAQKGK